MAQVSGSTLGVDFRVDAGTWAVALPRIEPCSSWRVLSLVGHVASQHLDRAFIGKPIASQRADLTDWDRKFNIRGQWSLKNLHAQSIRSAVLNGYVEVARAVGLDPYRMIARCDLPPACLTDPEVKVSAAAVGRLLEESAQQPGKPDFGLQLAERRSLSNIGALALLVRKQPTIRRAIEVLIGYMYLHSEASAEVGGGRGMAILKLAMDVGRPAPVRQGVELALGFLHRSLQQLLGESWKPRAIYFAHEPSDRKGAYRDSLEQR